MPKLTLFRVIRYRRKVKCKKASLLKLQRKSYKQGRNINKSEADNIKLTN